MEATRSDEEKRSEIPSKRKRMNKECCGLSEVEENVATRVHENERLVLAHTIAASSSSPQRPVVLLSRKKLLVLDINGLLADIVPFASRSYQPHTVISNKLVFRRPYCNEFLDFCFERFNVGLWSSRVRKNVDSFVDFLLGDSKHKLLFCWDQSHCTDTGYATIENKEKPLVLKEIRKLWENKDNSLPWRNGEYNESNTLMIDDSPYKALRNPAHTTIFPHSYRYKDSDSSLDNLSSHILKPEIDKADVNHE